MGEYHGLMEDDVGSTKGTQEENLAAWKGRGRCARRRWPGPSIGRGAAAPGTPRFFFFDFGP